MSSKFPKTAGYQFSPLKQPEFSKSNPVVTLTAHGKLIDSGGDSQLQFKTFSFGENIGVEGWFYPSFTFTLQRRSPTGGKASGEFIAAWHVASYGRHSTDNGAYYEITLLNGLSPMRAISLGSHHVPCGQDYQHVQTALPNDPGWPEGFPIEFFTPVDRVILFMKSAQDSC